MKVTVEINIMAWLRQCWNTVMALGLKLWSPKTFRIMMQGFIVLKNGDFHGTDKSGVLGYG